MRVDVGKIRRDFPILSRKIRGKRLIYIDNTATSQRPIQVIRAMEEFYRTYNANVHRGIHTLSEEASELYEEAHKVVARFIGAKGMQEIIFVRNTTEALNIVALSYGLGVIEKGDEIVISIMEHHSNMLPWIYLAERKGARIRVVDILDNHTLNYDMLAEIINEKTKIIAITQASNVLGTLNDIKKIAKLAREVDATLVVDGAQSVPHIPVDVRDIDCDFLAFSGHKMLGPTGIGALYGREELLEKMNPVFVGGGMISSVSLQIDGRHDVEWGVLPWKFEAGTPNIAGGIGLAEAVRYLENVGMQNIKEHEYKLTKYALEKLREGLGDNIDIYGPPPEERVGIIPFNIKGMDPHVVALYLDEYGICVRSGFHCAEPLHHRLGLEKGTVRASFYLYNTFEEIDIFVDALVEIFKKQK